MREDEETQLIAQLAGGMISFDLDFDHTYIENYTRGKRVDGPGKRMFCQWTVRVANRAALLFFSSVQPRDMHEGRGLIY